MKHPILLTGRNSFLMKRSFSLNIPERTHGWRNLLVATIFWIAAILLVAATSATAQPIIGSLSALNGSLGSMVNITGSGFNTTPANDVVYFGATRAAVTAASATSLTVTVPAGATYAPVSVENTATSLTASYSYPFLPTYDHSAYPAGAVGFANKVDFPGIAGTSPVQTLIKDVDGDGKADVVVLSYTNISIYCNTSISGTIASSSLAAPVSFPLPNPVVMGWTPRTLLAMGDIDGDGKPDLAYSIGDYGDSVYVMRNTSVSGSISFSPAIPFFGGTSDPSFNIQDIAIADIDGDGKADIFVTLQDDGYGVLLNTATPGSITPGSFATASYFALETPDKLNMAIGDIDGDGKPDIAFTTIGLPTILVKQNTSSPGSVSFGSAVAFSTNAIYPLGYSQSIVICDLDGDGMQDLAVTNYLDTTISILRNTMTSAGTINSSSFSSAVRFPSGYAVKALAVADLDGDGKPDLVAGGCEEDGTAGYPWNADLSIYLYRNTSTPGSITPGSFTVLPRPVGHRHMINIAIGDLDGDGIPDLVTVNNGDSNISVLRGAPVAPVAITSVNPIIAAPGTTVTITGNNFNATGANNVVYFGATRATVTAASSTSLSVTVPIGATHDRITVYNTATQTTGYSQYQFLPTYTDPAAIPNTVIFERAVKFPDTLTGAAHDAVILDIDGDGKADVLVAAAYGFAVYRNTAASGSVTSGSFAPPIYFNTGGSSSMDIATGDIDGDGKPDVAIATGLGTSIFRNTSTAGSVSFAATLQIPAPWTSGGVGSVKIADLNGDGKAELIIGDANVGISIYWNIGSPGSIDANSFAIPIDYTLSDGFATLGMAIGDLDGDGKPDAAISNGGNKIFVFKNIAAGFADPITLTTSNSIGYHVIIADIDGDGKPDLIGSNNSTYDSTISIFRNTSTPGNIDTTSFASPFALSTGLVAASASLADFNGDGKPDLLLTHIGAYINQNISIYRNTATPGVINSSSFAAPVDSTVVYSTVVVAGDIDGDGKADIVAGISQGDTIIGGIAVLRNNPHLPAITGNAPVCVGAVMQLHDALGGGAWSSTEATVTVGSAGLITGVSAGTASITYTYPPSFYATVVVTVNPGGLPHITSVSPMKGNVASAVTITGTNFSTTTSEDVTYFGATKANVFAASSTLLNVTVPSGATYMPVSVTNPACGLMAYADQSFLQTYDNSPYLFGTVHFDPKVDLTVGIWGDALAFSDIDGDGKVDMFATSATSNTIWVYLNTSSSGSIASSSFAAPLIIPCGNTPTGVTAADIDGDGKPDLAVVTAGDAKVSVLRNTSSPGTLSFDTPVVFTTGGGGAMVAISDIDGDGIPDMAVANSADHTVSIFHGASTPGVISFGPQVVLSAGSTPYHVSIMDIDGDGKPDLTVSNIDGASIFVWRNLSSPGTINPGSFASPLTFVTGGTPSGLSMGDIDGDGKPEMVIADENDNDISVFLNTSSVGVISFAPRVTFATGSVPMGTAISDIDGDGKPDISVINNGDNTVSVLRNTSSVGSISYALGGTYPTNGGPYGVVSGDIDGDGKPDLAVLNNGSNTISVLRNNPVPASGILGTPTLCVGSTSTLSSFTSGVGEWASSATGVAVVDSSTGIVTGISPGTATIVFSGPLGYSTMQQITVNAAPASISGTSGIDVGASAILSDDTIGGIWSSNPISIATIDLAGNVTGIAAGSVIISYTLPDGCTATQTLNVNPAVLLPGSLQSGIVSTYAPFLPAYETRGLVVDSSNNIYVADATTFTIKKISRSGIVTVVAGNGTSGYSGDGGPALAAQLGAPAGLAIDASGNLYVADSSNSIVRKISTSGIITTVAGHTWGNSSGDGGPATAATLAAPYYIALDNAGNLYISDGYNANVRKVNTSGIISTIAGFQGAGAGPITGFSGDGGPATNALLNYPGQITVDAHQNVYVNDVNNNRVRKIDSLGTITTIAGNGINGNSGDWGPANLAAITRCNGLKTDATGNIYLTGGLTGEHIRKINPAGIITTIAGTTEGYSGDGGPASLGSFDMTGPFDFDAYGNMFVADIANHEIREIKYHADIFADSFSVFIDNHCGALNFSTETHPTAATALSTDFGDGTNTITPLSPGDPGTMYANVPHVYSAPGTYSIKEVLWNGATAIDSILFSHQYLLCNNFAVQFYYDNNGNCTKDSSESWSFPPVTVEIDSNGVAVDTQTATSGLYYTAFGGPGDIYSFKVISAPAGLVPTCSGSGIVYDTLQSIIYHVTNNYIGFTCAGTSGFDLAENISATAGRHMAYGTIVVSNNYCAPKAGVVTLNIDPKYTFDASVPAPSSVVGNTVTWNLSSLSSMLAPQNINYTLNRPGAWLIPGDTILSIISVTPISGDADTSNNTTIRVDTVKSSYDPNDMSVVPGGYILPGTMLQYTINFENTGNDTAHNIAVMDTLPDNVNVNSLRIDAATAVMNITIYNAGGHNIVKFDFPRINLLDSTHPNQCTGMVMFHIKPKNGLADGTALFNHAGIFFDDNPVVMTDTVENIISLIHGPNHVCVGGQITLSDVPTNGVWTVSNANAAISADTITGVTAGIDTFIYTTTTKYGSESVTKIVTVNVAPGAITGVAVLCAGSAVILSDATPGGSWSSNNTAIANVGSGTGIVTGTSAGTATVTYTLSGGCINTNVVTVNPTPLPILGTRSACSGLTTALTDVTAGGAWNSSNPTVASVGSGTGVATGVSPGTSTISYTLATGCSVSATVTINPLPPAIGGVMHTCVGSALTLTDATGGGTWSSASPTVAVSTGIITGVSVGTALITYTLTTGCMATTMATINAIPGSIAGATSVCAGTAATVTDAVAAGIWSSSNPTILTIGTSGVISGVSAGTATITYMVITGCMATKAMTVNPAPSAISGPATLCNGASIFLTDASTGGSWSSGNPAVAAIGSSTGTVSGLSVGVASITYATAAGCTTSSLVTINPLPAIITGPTTVCVTSTIMLSDAGTGGNWSSSNPSVSTIGSGTGVVTGVTEGVSNITYTLTTGCFTATIVTVNPLPAAITGTTTACAGAVISLSDLTSGGTWASSTPAIAAVGSTGTVSAVSSGTAVISYILNTGCIALYTVTINSAPAPIAGSAAECTGSTSSLSDITPGGTWSSSAIATATASTTGVITGISAGTVIISYTLPSSCYTTVINTVNPLPSPITGAGGICVGSATPLAATPAGGNWMSSDPLIATTDISGIVSAVSAGTADITYTIAGSCYTTFTVTVNSSPGPITGSFSLCAGGTADMSNPTPDGTWSSSTPGIASVATIGASTGVVIGEAAGVDTISYVVTAGCIATALVTVYAVPALSVTATQAGCGGSYDLVASGALFYNWTPSAGITCGACSANTVNPNVTTTYTVTGAGPTGCTAKETVTLNANRITGHVFASGSTADVMRVWLIEFNPGDSSMITRDSMLTCIDGGVPYYEFDGAPAGHYLVSATLLSSVPGTTGYAPSYGLSSPYWDTAITITHGSATDTQRINMIYGTVPAGTGSISGIIVSDAGAPVPGMLVYLMNTSNNVLTYTYTDGTGAYTFGALADQSYIIYPEAYKYYTTESAVVTLIASSETVTTVNFMQYLSIGTIIPYSDLAVSAQKIMSGISIYPNPASGLISVAWQQQSTGNAMVIITDMAGREVYRSSIDINVASGEAQIDISTLKEGIYMLSIRSGSINFNKKLVVE
jgi:uncharacterized repeat protein (TIGR01451 family)